ncbi:ribbon-helix-helix protein, CopG family [Eilatimonas milleporae]|uniref:Ribbon-helix-helix CopG family protein n=1 Tax=Eilatimonas milleporae TaxID=911205 RepID=A0A3M0CI91_9PROT|nr:ribbon-helix-helix protein, CopG family [Eilatimonas milleporae]RMB09042.1 ribbon-helix-helix CopG family protein [Eilatimonas milleporae]
MLVPLGTRLEKATYDKFINLAETNGLSRSELLRVLVEEAVKGDKFRPVTEDKVLFTMLGIVTKSFFLNQFLAEALDKKSAKAVLENAEVYLLDKGIIQPCDPEADDV